MFCYVFPKLTELFYNFVLFFLALKSLFKDFLNLSLERLVLLLDNVPHASYLSLEGHLKFIQIQIAILLTISLHNWLLWWPMRDLTSWYLPVLLWYQRWSLTALIWCLLNSWYIKLKPSFFLLNWRWHLLSSLNELLVELASSFSLVLRLLSFLLLSICKLLTILCQFSLEPRFLIKLFLFLFL
jgi:hypothetical protein